VGEAELKALLERMPAIAKAVNAFQSEAVQQQAFRALVGSAAGDDVDADDEEETGSRSTSRPKKRPAGRKKAAKRPAKAAGEKKAAKRAARRSGKGPSIVKDLNLRPSGKKTFKAFADEKQPQTHHERCVVAVHYLKNTLGIDGVTVDHVFSCYRDMNWRLPTNFANSLQVTSSLKGWLDTSDMDNIRLTVPGTNFVEHDLPAKAK
jgi:hypothetical protein